MLVITPEETLPVVGVSQQKDAIRDLDLEFFSSNPRQATGNSMDKVPESSLRRLCIRQWENADRLCLSLF